MRAAPRPGQRCHLNIVEGLRYICRCHLLNLRASRRRLSGASANWFHHCLCDVPDHQLARAPWRESRHRFALSRFIVVVAVLVVGVVCILSPILWSDHGSPGAASPEQPCCGGDLNEMISNAKTLNNTPLKEYLDDNLFVAGRGIEVDLRSLPSLAAGVPCSSPIRPRSCS